MAFWPMTSLPVVAFGWSTARFGAIGTMGCMCAPLNSRFAALALRTTPRTPCIATTTTPRISSVQCTAHSLWATDMASQRMPSAKVNPSRPPCRFTHRMGSTRVHLLTQATPPPDYISKTIFEDNWLSNNTERPLHIEITKSPSTSFAEVIRDYSTRVSGNVFEVKQNTRPVVWVTRVHDGLSLSSLL